MSSLSRARIASTWEFPSCPCRLGGRGVVQSYLPIVTLYLGGNASRLSLQRSYALIDISGWTLAEHNPFTMAVLLGNESLIVEEIESKEENEPAPVKESKTRYAVDLG